MGKILAVCTSETKGVHKRDVKTAHFIESFGIEGDAHGGDGHRQVSLLSADKINDFRAKGAKVIDGDFGENLIVEGMDLKEFPIGTRFSCNDVVLELSQIGKECHTKCNIYYSMGDCIMPREGVFAIVVKGGTISVGDELEVLT